MTNGLARMKFLAQVAEVKAGTRGFISIASFVKENGSTREQLKSIAEKNGLVCHNHGRYGLCCLSPEAR
jgi:hypothetical protein